MLNVRIPAPTFLRRERDHRTPTGAPAADDVLAAPFQLRVQTGPGQPPVLVLAGEIDLAAVPAITAAADLLMSARGGVPRTSTEGHDGLVYVGLASVTFLDCAALGALVGLGNRLGARATRLVVKDASPTALRLLTLTRHTHHLLPAGLDG